MLDLNFLPQTRSPGELEMDFSKKRIIYIYVCGELKLKLIFTVGETSFVISKINLKNPLLLYRSILNNRQKVLPRPF